MGQKVVVAAVAADEMAQVVDEMVRVEAEAEDFPLVVWMAFGSSPAGMAVESACSAVVPAPLPNSYYPDVRGQQALRTALEKRGYG